MESKWIYKSFEVKEGLKPGSAEFRYFFTVSADGQKKCNYCVWIVDEALERFDADKNFDTIVASHRDTWQGWVRGKIDAADFSNRALLIEKTGEKEINLSDIKEHVKMR